MTDPTPPHVYPACVDCTHPHGVHLIVRKGAVRHRGPCSSGHGAAGVVCPCQRYRAGVTP